MSIFKITNFIGYKLTSYLLDFIISYKRNIFIKYNFFNNQIRQINKLSVEYMSKILFFVKSI